ncbi:MAG TPA: universal stress protein [Chthoniobacterales bacterium]
MKTKKPSRPSPVERRQASRPRPRALAKPFAIQKILVPIDFSEAGRPALAYARSMAGLTGATLCLLHVLHHIFPEGDVYFQRQGSYAGDTLFAVRERVTRELGTLQVEQLEGIKTDCEIREGVPSVEILKAAKALGADLIIMATHGYTGLHRLLIGSTTERVVRQAECPVLVVRSWADRKSRPAGSSNRRTRSR